MSRFVIRARLEIDEITGKLDALDYDLYDGSKQIGRFNIAGEAVEKANEILVGEAAPRRRGGRTKTLIRTSE